MRGVLLFILIMGASGAFAQSIPLTGNIAIQNSKYETGTRRFVSGASVRAPFAKAASSDAKGQFQLTFFGVEQGSSVRITVGKTGFAVVNDKELLHVILGRSPELTVVMTDPAKLAEAEATFYQVTTANIDRDFDRKVELLMDSTVALEHRLATLSDQLNDSLTTLQQAIATITQQRGSAMDRVQGIAREMALVDLDQTSSRYVEAYEALRKGDVQQTLLLLDHDQLNAEYARAADRKAEGEKLVGQANTSIRQVYQSYRLKCMVLLTNSAFVECLEVFEVMQGMLMQQADVFPTDALTDLVKERGEVLITLGRFEEARSLVAKALERTAQSGAVPSRMEAELCQLLARVNDRQGHYQNALEYADRAIALRSQIPGADTAAMDLAVKAEALAEIGRMDEALDVLLHATSLQSRDSTTPMLEREYVMSSLVVLYTERGEMLRVVELGEEAFSLLQAAPHPDKQRMASCQNNIGVAYGTMERSDSAMVHLEYSLAIEKEIFGMDHPATANTLSNLARVYQDLGFPEKALTTFEQALAIQLRMLGPDHPLLVPTYNNMGTTVSRLGDSKRAFGLWDEALRIVRSAPQPDPVGEALCLGYLVEPYRAAGRCDTVLTILKDCMRIDSTLFGMASEKVADVNYDKGSCLDSLGDFTAAITAYEQALAFYLKEFPVTNGKVLVARLGIAHALLRSGRLDEALTMAEQAVKDAPTGGAKWMLYTIEHESGNDAKALEWLSACYAARKDNPKAPAAMKERTRVALKNLATKLGRTDVLKEYNLE